VPAVGGTTLTADPVTGDYVSETSWNGQSGLSQAREHLGTASATYTPVHRAQLTGISAHHAGQHVRVAGIALGARHAVAFPVPRGLQRVHLVYHIPDLYRTFNLVRLARSGEGFQA
jgi:hypothetical protein